MPQTSKAGRTDAGYTYVAMLVVLVGLALAAQVTSVPSATTAKRAIEEQIIFEGRAYRDAIARYWAFGDEATYPASLDDLLNDSRDPNVRHIRRLYNLDGWRVEYGADGGLQGVFPNRSDTPLKQSGFASDLSEFEESATYEAWVFRFVPEEEG